MIAPEISAPNVRTQLRNKRHWWQARTRPISVPYVTKSDSKKAKPTEADLRAAKRLKRLWLAMPRDRRPTQDQLADRYGEGGSQSLISQYMNGHIPLNLRAVLFFARELGCSPLEIYPDLPGLDAVIGGRPALRAAEAPAAYSEEAHAVDAEWNTFSIEQKRSILEMIKLAGVIGVTSSPTKPRKSVDPAIRHATAAAELRRERRRKRGAG